MVEELQVVVWSGVSLRKENDSADAADDAKKGKKPKKSILEKIGNLEIPFWDSDKESSKSSIPSWDHTPANSEEARNIAIKREIRKSKEK